MNKYKVLLYYKYVYISDPEKLKQDQLDICKKLNLKGRIIVANEGINGTVDGLEENILQYIEYMKKNKDFEDIHFKLSVGGGSDFPRLSVKVRPEIVSTHLTGENAIDPHIDAAPYVYPNQLHEWFKEGKEFYLVDMRNSFEYKIGHFKNSIDSTFDHFRDLPVVTKKIEDLKNKLVVTACTGGVRCEKASGYLAKNGFKNVYQLYGGMQTYMQEYPGDDFLGKLYVFDKRVAVSFAPANKHIAVGKCEKCGQTCEQYVNCGLPSCNKHFICCDNCKDIKYNKFFCSENCLNSYSKLPINISHAYKATK